MLKAKIPDGPLEQKWNLYRSTAKLVSPANRKKLDVIVVGTGLSGSSLAASLAEAGYLGTCFFFPDTTRRAHSVAAPGGGKPRKDHQNNWGPLFPLFPATFNDAPFPFRATTPYPFAH